MKISSAIKIESTPEIVFGWLENPEKAKQWMTSVSEGEIILETPERVGTKFREIVQDDNGTIEMEGIITGFEPDKSIAFHLDSRVNTVEVKYCIEEIEEGVRLEYYANIRWKFPVNILCLVIGGNIKQSIIDQLSEELNTLKKLCEIH